MTESDHSLPVRLFDTCFVCCDFGWDLRASCSALGRLRLALVASVALRALLVSPGASALGRAALVAASGGGGSTCVQHSVEALPRRQALVVAGGSGAPLSVARCFAILDGNVSNIGTNHEHEQLSCKGDENNRQLTPGSNIIHTK